MPKKRIYGFVVAPDGSVVKLDSQTNTEMQCTDFTGAALPHEENVTYM